MLAVAAATERVATVYAAVRGIRNAGPTGFGPMIAGNVPVSAAVAWTAAVLGSGAAVAVACSVPLGWILLPQGIAIAGAWLLREHAGRRLGGMTGDVFGALIESATVVTLIEVALW